MAEKLGLSNEVRELKLGSSFDGGAPVAYHSIRYDFKPASVDTSQVASVDIGEGHSVTVTVPHVEGSGTSNTVYKGNKRECQKECILVIDHKTGEITLEKLSNNITLKKTRIEGSSRAGQMNVRPHTPTDKLKDLKTSPTKTKKKSPPMTSSQPTPQSVPQKTMATKEAPASDMISSSSSSSGSDSSDSEAETPKAAPAKANPTKPAHTTPHQKSGYHHSMLSMDLQLSDSDSDSD